MEQQSLTNVLLIDDDLLVLDDLQSMIDWKGNGYWQDGSGGEYNKDRESAFVNTRVKVSIEQAIKDIEEKNIKRKKKE